MEFRALLQKEIWSKNTSRRILAVLGIIFASLSVVSLSIYLWLTVEGLWLTSGERTAGRAALKEVDALQQSKEMSDEQYSVVEKKAAEDIQVATRATHTHRDKYIAQALDLYLQMTGMKREHQKIVQRIPKLAAQDSCGFAPESILRGELHAALD